MQSDLQNFINFYKSIGIDCLVNIRDGCQKIYLATTELDDSKLFTASSEKFDGYSNFYCEVIFDMEGKFISQGFWE